MVCLSIECIATLAVGMEWGTSMLLGVAFSSAVEIKVNDVGLVLPVPPGGMANNHRAVNVLVLHIWWTVCKSRWCQLFPGVSCRSRAATSIGLPENGRRWIRKPPADLAGWCRNVGGLFGERSIEERVEWSVCEVSHKRVWQARVEYGKGSGLWA